MASSFLCSPNKYSLSDNVIGGVVQRRPDRFEDNREVFRSFTTARNFNSAERPQSRHNRLPPLESLANMASKRSNPEEPEPTRKLKVPASQRERCRINQAWYRKRQRKHADDLDGSIRQLKEEVQDLETKRQTSLRYAPANENVWNVATEYFRLFRYGYNTPVSTPKRISPSPFAITGSKFDATPLQTNLQLEFLRGSMSPDVTDRMLCGADALLENWRLLSLYYDDVNVKAQTLGTGWCQWFPSGEDRFECYHY